MKQVVVSYFLLIMGFSASMKFPKLESENETSFSGPYPDPTRLLPNLGQPDVYGDTEQKPDFYRGNLQPLPPVNQKGDASGAIEDPNKDLVESDTLEVTYTGYGGKISFNTGLFGNQRDSFGEVVRENQETSLKFYGNDNKVHYINVKYEPYFIPQPALQSAPILTPRGGLTGKR